MREILFRAKSREDGEWVYGGYFTAKDYLSGETLHFISTKECESFPHGEFTDATEIDPDTIGQYTGLTDKNGKKIFEGDVFKFDDEVWEGCNSECGMEWGSWAVENYAVVGFDEYEGRFDFTRYKYKENSVEADLHENHDLEFSDFVRELEIVGNIHDNPEMLGDADA